MSEGGPSTSAYASEPRSGKRVADEADLSQSEAPSSKVAKLSVPVAMSVTRDDAAVADVPELCKATNDTSPLVTDSQAAVLSVDSTPLADKGSGAPEAHGGKQASMSVGTGNEGPPTDSLDIAQALLKHSNTPLATEEDPTMMDI